MRALTLSLLSVALACAERPPPMTFAEAGLHPPPLATTPLPRRSALVERTRDLLDAIERETGERPVLDAEDFFVPRPRPLRARTLSEERAALATEVLRSTDAAEATVATLEKARRVLLWDRLASGHVAAVERELVDAALRRATELLPVPEQRHARQSFDWPIDPPQLTSRFGVRRDPFGAGRRLHAGVDLSALVGQTVHASSDGVVIFAGHRGGYGLHVDVEHEGGYVTRYAHLSDIDVRAKEHVKGGMPIGRAGQTGRATGPHLHFELWLDGLPINPEDELPALLPPLAGK